jgi:hypothetical protein
VRCWIWSDLAPLLLAGCGIGELPKRASDTIGSGKVLALDGLEGRWGGTVHPGDGSACGPERHGLMRVGDGKFAFDPFESTTVINGTVEKDTLSGTLTRPGGGHQTLSISFTGHAREDAGGKQTIDGVLTSGKCSWQVALERV